MPLGNALDTVLDQFARIVAINFVLRRTGQGDVNRHAPGLLAGFVFEAKLFGIFGNAAVMVILDIHQRIEFLARKACLVNHGATGIRTGHDLATEFKDFFDGILGNVARTGDRDAQTLQAHVLACQLLLDEVHQAVTCRLGTDQAATERQPLAGKNASRIIGKLFHHARHKTDFTPADTDVAGRYVGIRPEMAIQLHHQRLTEAHHLATALALWIEIGTAFAAAHRQGGQRILEGLLKSKKLEDR